VRSSRTLVASVIAILALTASSAMAAGLSDPIPQPIRNSHVRVALAPVLDGLVSPVAATQAPGDRHHLYVVDQAGQLWGTSLNHGRHNRHHKWLVADLSGLLVENLGNPIPVPGYDERGFLGLAFSPHFQHDGLLYTFTSEDVTEPADFSTPLPAGVEPDDQAVVTEWKVANRHARHITVDPASRRVLMRIDKPQFNHNGGELAFGPDGMLYISIGDGGNADDQGDGHAPGGNAQSLAPGNVLGKVLRINPRGHNSANGQYGIPSSNPFVGREGADEIWALGFRNPYRFSFDAKTGDLWVADVGQNDIEEVDVVKPGRNYGWPVKEGTFLFDMNGDADGFVTANSPGMPAGLVDPVSQYDHTAPGGVRCGGGAPPEACQGIATVGGTVYRGDDIRGLKGRYVFGDYSRAFAQPLGRLWVKFRHTVRALPDPGIAVFGFASDRHGEMYVLGNHTGVLSEQTGVVLALVSARHHHHDD
jgi:glucose/arabinose dehydrogenase